MSSLQSLREFISERLAAAAEEIFRHCEGTIVQYEQELCRQRRLLDIYKPQLQLNAIVLPQHHVTEQENCKNKHENFQVEQKEPDTPRIKEEKEEPEPLQIQEEHKGLCKFQIEEQLDLKQETDNVMDTPIYEVEVVIHDEDEHNIADLENQQSLNDTDCQDEEGSEHEEATSTSEIRDQKKRMDQNQVHNLDSSQISDSRCESDVRKDFKETSWVKKCKKSQKENRLSHSKFSKRSEVISNMCIDKKRAYDERPHVCQECGKRFVFLSTLKSHMIIHAEKKPFSCQLCDKCFSKPIDLQRHMRTHTGEKPFTCKACDKSFCIKSDLKRHMATHTGEKPFSCKECDKSFSQLSNLKRHMSTHTGAKPFSCKECDKSFSQISNLKIHMRTHTG